MKNEFNKMKKQPQKTLLMLLAIITASSIFTFGVILPQFKAASFTPLVEKELLSKEEEQKLIDAHKEAMENREIPNFQSVFSKTKTADFVGSTIVEFYLPTERIGEMNDAIMMFLEEKQVGAVDDGHFLGAAEISNQPMTKFNGENIAIINVWGILEETKLKGGDTAYISHLDYLYDGRRFEEIPQLAANEIVVNNLFAEKMNVKVGDVIANDYGNEFIVKEIKNLRLDNIEEKYLDFIKKYLIRPEVYTNSSVIFETYDVEKRVEVRIDDIPDEALVEIFLEGAFNYETHQREMGEKITIKASEYREKHYLEREKSIGETVDISYIDSIFYLFADGVYRSDPSDTPYEYLEYEHSRLVYHFTEQELAEATMDFITTML